MDRRSRGPYPARADRPPPPHGSGLHPTLAGQTLALPSHQAMTIPALRAIIFDFNEVIADDEPTHFLAFQQALAEDGLALTKEEYYGAYLGMDERTCAGALLEAITGRHDPARVQRIAERKAALFASLTETRRPPLFPGVVEFVTRASARYRLAIASGGTRHQIAFALHCRPTGPAFAVIGPA